MGVELCCSVLCLLKYLSICDSRCNEPYLNDAIKYLGYNHINFSQLENFPFLPLRECEHLTKEHVKMFVLNFIAQSDLFVYSKKSPGK